MWETPLKQNYSFDAVIYSSKTELNDANKLKTRLWNPNLVKQNL